MAGDVSRRNGLLGGRPRGSLSFTTKMREEMMLEIQNRTYDMTQHLLRAQLTLALGYTELWKIEKELVVGPKGGQKYIKKRPEKVTSTAEVEEYLISLIDQENAEILDEPIEEEDNPDATYFYIVTVPPNNAAIEALQDRVLGKTPQKLGIGNPDGSNLGEPSDLVKALAAKLNEVHGTTSVGSDGAAPRIMDGQVPGQDQ